MYVLKGFFVRLKSFLILLLLKQLFFVKDLHEVWQQRNFMFTIIYITFTPFYTDYVLFKLKLTLLGLLGIIIFLENMFFLLSKFVVYNLSGNAVILALVLDIVLPCHNFLPRSK